MLGSNFAQHLPDANSIGRDSLDIRQIDNIHKAIAQADAQLVINCAAHTNVDLAETNPDDAWRTNAILPGILGSACRAVGATLIHFSSTGIYGDWKEGMYEEDDPLHPTTVHHRSKAAGETAVRESGCEHLIVRTGWLFGGHPGLAKNFVWKRLVEAANISELTADASQRGNPTAVSDVVRQTIAAFHSGYRGTINLVSQGSASRFEYVDHIIRSAGLYCRVTPSTKPFVRAARVSPNETAVNRRLQLLGLDAMPTWQDALDQYVMELRQTPEWLQLRSKV
jgi:dTDP-4-dehydrorhamnose reductase